MHVSPHNMLSKLSRRNVEIQKEDEIATRSHEEIEGRNKKMACLLQNIWIKFILRVCTNTA